MKQNKKGFTLIEIMVVMTIIAVLVGLMVLAINTARRQQFNTQRRNSVTGLRAALEAYYATNMSYPRTSGVAGVTGFSLVTTGGELAGYLSDAEVTNLDDPSGPSERTRICYASTIKGVYALWLNPQPRPNVATCPPMIDSSGQPLAPARGWQDFSLR